MTLRTLTYMAFVLMLFFSLKDNGWAQESKLPPCPWYVSAVNFNNCIGKSIDGHGNKYVGKFKHGKYSGQGTLTLANGNKYIGEFKDGWPNGQGTATFGYGKQKGDQYVGEWRDGKHNGQGTYTSANGDKYVGAFRDDKRNGQGTFTFGNGPLKGSQYVGEFKDGNLNGQGTLTLASGEKYVGEFKDAKMDGQGTYTNANGEKYVGEFKDAKMDGQGTYTSANGNKYVGQFRNDKPNGHIILYAASGDIIQQGIYENGILKTNEASPIQASGNNHRVQMVKDGGTYAVPVIINNVLTLHFIVDSGASDVTILADVAMTLARTGTIKESDFIGRQKYKLADGSTIDSNQFIIRTLKVGDQIVENVRGSIGNEQGSLLLGQSFLEKFKSWSMDNGTHELVLE